MLESLPSADEHVLFQQAGIHWDLAMLEAAAGSSGGGCRRGDAGGASTTNAAATRTSYINARLLIAEHGTTDEAVLQEIFTGLPTGDDLWYRAGWLLVDRLRTLGRPADADALENRLQT